LVYVFVILDLPAAINESEPVRQTSTVYEPVQYENKSDPLRFESLFEEWKAHDQWIRACTDADITTIQPWMIAVETGLDTDSVVECLLPGSDANARAFVHNPPFYNWGAYTIERGGEVLFRNNDSILIITTQDWAIEQVLYVSPDTYLVNFGYSTHSRVYIVHPEERGERLLTNANRISIQDADNLIFRADGFKTYCPGACWFNFIIDYHGQILSSPDEGDECPSVETIAENTTLDLSRVTQSSICYALR
jgi:hypothetical protein